MKLRLALIPGLLLTSACSVGPDTTSGGGTSGTATATTGSTTDVVPTGSGSTGDASSGGLTEAGTGVTTGETTVSTSGTTSGSTGGTTSSTTGETSDGTTGAAACEAIVGSTDCAALVAVSPDLTLEECMTCQGAACGQEPVCDDQYPCVEGSIVLRGCCSDQDCADLTPYCGMHIGTNNVCVLHDDL